jgi:hypothetical protein
MSGTPVIEIERLRKFYKGKHRGVDGVDLEIYQGEIFGFLGPNGAGKTTTIRILLDLIRADSGRARVFGLDIRRDSEEIRRRTGYLPGEHGFYDGHRVYFRDRDESSSLIAFYDVETNEHGAYPGDLRMICPIGNRQAYHTKCSHYPDYEVVSQRKEHGVFIQNLDTGGSKRIVTVYDCWQMHPRRDEIANWHLYVKHTKWSPDGTRLMFVFTNEIRYAPKYGENPRVKDVYVVNPDGTKLRRVGEFGNHPLWHPDNREILTNSHFPGRPGNNLVLTDIETGDHRLATDCVAGTGHPSFSPDGKFIAIERVSAKDGRGEIHLIDVKANSSVRMYPTQIPSGSSY